ncbi:MAG: hypothetical protein ABIJ96_04200 [Elusimicrobiota bacterium]
MSIAAWLLVGLLGAAGAQETSVPSQFWLKSYPIQEVGAHWHIDLQVEDFHKSRRKILGWMRKYEASSRLPLEGTGSTSEFKFQQFSFAISRTAAQKVFAQLKRLGVVRRAQQAESGLPDYSQEISLKLGRLRAEQQAGGEILRRLTAVGALTEELITHLAEAEAAQLRARDTVLLNIVLEEKRP